MVRSIGKKLWREESGAVASIYALALPALIAIGGIAFDYTRLAAMDTELQNAADQAALAAVTQLDGKVGACSRASDAAVTLVSNQTVFANDGGTPAVVVTSQPNCGATGSIQFYSVYNETSKVLATSDADARFVRVTVNARTAKYALTPIVGAFNSGAVDATAVAGLGSAICKVPPVMFCNPAEPKTGAVGGDFDGDYYQGAGLLLISGAPNFPGNFGFLDTGFVTNGANPTPDLARALGHNAPPGNCSPIDDVGTTPGNRDVVFNAFNTRFDVDTNGANTCPSGGTCGPSLNTRKDLVRRNQCGTSGNNGWQASANPYRPTTTTPLTSGYPDVMGHPRDICHAVSETGVCDGNGDGTLGDIIGDKIWDRNAYFMVNYGWNSSQWQTNTGLSSQATRYEVYKWELANPPTAIQNVGGGRSAHNAPVCLTAAPANIPDRRRISAAVVNCREEAAQGNTTVKVIRWVDVFLVEPAFVRYRGSTKVTDDNNVYVEVIGNTDLAGGGSGGQVVRRDKPYLIE